MKKEYWYNVVTEHHLRIDYDKIYEAAQSLLKKSNKEEPTYEDIYFEFCDSIEYYLGTVCDIDDFIEDDNEYVCECIILDWTNYIEENYGEI